MRVLINILSVGSLSGEHVAFGYTGYLIKNLSSNDKVWVLHYEGQDLPENLNSPDMQFVSISDKLRHWAIRSVWEPIAIRRLVKKEAIDRIVTYSGMVTPFVSVPQIVLAQNPWAFIRSARSGFSDAIKAFMQRRAYRRAYLNASQMIYVSNHLHDLYNENFVAKSEKQSPAVIAHEGLYGSLFDATSQLASLERIPYSVLSVSAYARWKGVETVVAAIDRLRNDGVPATLSLVGPWADSTYEKLIRDQVQNLGLDEVIKFYGKVDVSELHHHYATHQVFCLMSSCESFGIPAAEAMAFGTPVVSSTDSAISEVCAGAGLFGSSGDVDWTAKALQELLETTSLWSECSKTARKRATELTWANASIPLLESLGLKTSESASRNKVVQETTVA